MRRRCNNPNSDKFADYGGRGIKVCSEWEDFEAFVRDVGKRPSPQHTLDRIRVNGNYEPGNVRWATPKAQTRNRRNTLKVSYQGKRKPLAAWVESLGLNYELARQRIFIAGWPPERAFTEPKRERIAA